MQEPRSSSLLMYQLLEAFSLLLIINLFVSVLKAKFVLSSGL